MYIIFLCINVYKGLKCFFLYESQKLQRCLESLEKVQSCSHERKEKLRKALTLEYTSSDESDLSDDENSDHLKLKGYLVKKLPWERSALRKVKEQLDSRYLKSLPPRSRGSILPRRNHSKMSTRPVPVDILEWAVRPPTNEDISGIRPLSHSTPRAHHSV